MKHGVHVGHFALNELKLTNALTKLLAVVNIGNDVVHDRLHDAQRTRCQHSTLVVQAAHEHFGAHVQAAQNIFCWHFNIVKHQLARVAAAHAQLVELLRHREALHVFFYQECSDAACAQLGLCFGVHHQGVGIGAVGDPHFVAIQNVVATFVFGLQFHADHI